MNPLRLRATNYRTFGELDIAFHDGLVGILGELRDAPEGADSNGAGKSSILEAIQTCLFGRRSLQGLRTRGTDGELMLELTFEHAGQTYRARRRAKSKTIPPDFERLDLDGDPLPSGEPPSVPEYLSWTPLTCGSAKETDALIVETIGLSKDTYRNSSYLAQGDGSYADPARDPKQRKELLVEAVLGRDPVWPRLEKLAKERRKHALLQLSRVAGTSAAALTLVEGKRDLLIDLTETMSALAETKQQLEGADLDLAAIVQRYQAARDGAAKRTACEAELAAATQTLTLLRDADSNVKAAALQLTLVRSELDGLPTPASTDELVARERELIDAIAAHEKARTEHLTAAERARQFEAQRVDLLRQADEEDGFANAIRERARMVEAKDDATCDLCGQAVHDTAKTKVVAEYASQAKAFTDRATARREQAAAIEIAAVPAAPVGDPPTVALATVRAQLATAQQAQQQRVRLEERCRTLEAAVTGEPDLQDRIATALALVTAKRALLDEIEPVDITTIERAGAVARERQAMIRRTVEDLQAQVVRLTERRTQIEAAEAQLTAAAAETAELQALVDRDTMLEQACGRDGIPALIIENGAIPYLETEATRILGELGTSYQVELRTQAELKDGSGLRDTLEVVVLDDTGEAPYDDFSGGEQTRVGLALRIALAELLATRRGAESRLLALDEPSYLDQAGMTALLRVLQELVTGGVFRQALLVSHVPELRDSLDQTIVVVKEHGRSRVEDAHAEPALEEIAA